MDVQTLAAQAGANIKDAGEISDGYHTFNQLYHDRLILFAAMVNTFKDLSWKSHHHSDGSEPFGGGWFIVGINTPEGQYTYHYENKDWDLFDCKEIPEAPEFDGHTADDVERVLSLSTDPENELYNWAKEEVRLAIENETKLAESSDEADFGTKIYNDALQAFKPMCMQGHSGSSYGITKGIVKKLLDGKPLTPITDTPDGWNEVSRVGSSENGYKLYQCKRRSSLFKHVYSTGDIVYSDVDQAVKIDQNKQTWNSQLVTKIIQTMFPISMPYYPEEPILVYCEDFLFDPKNGDYDTVGVFYAIKANGDEIQINRYFRESEGPSGWDEITFEEYDRRKKEVQMNAENMQ